MSHVQINVNVRTSGEYHAIELYVGKPARLVYSIPSPLAVHATPEGDAYLFTHSPFNQDPKNYVVHDSLEVAHLLNLIIQHIPRFYFSNLHSKQFAMLNSTREQYLAKFWAIDTSNAVLDALDQAIAIIVDNAVSNILSIEVCLGATFATSIDKILKDLTVSTGVANTASESKRTKKANK